MLDAAEEARSFIHGRTRNDLKCNRMLLLSLVKCIEIIGEAASRLDCKTKDKYPEIPWADITAMRNRLIHAYFDVDSDRVWDTVVDDLPPLVTELKAILSKESL
jgi:uncharacterized protein with HEPN domain